MLAEISARIGQAAKKSVDEVHRRGCSTAAEPMPIEREVAGLIPAGCWAFFFFYSQ